MLGNRRLFVLIVVGDAICGKAIARLVESVGHDPFVVASEAEALDALGFVQFDVMLLDLSTAPRNVLEIARLQRFATLGDTVTPVIAVGDASDSSFHAAQTDEAVDFVLRKPVCPSELLETFECAAVPARALILAN